MATFEKNKVKFLRGADEDFNSAPIEDGQILVVLSENKDSVTLYTDIENERHPFVVDEEWLKGWFVEHGSGTTPTLQEVITSGNEFITTIHGFRLRTRFTGSSIEIAHIADDGTVVSNANISPNMISTFTGGAGSGQAIQLNPVAGITDGTFQEGNQWFNYPVLSSNPDSRRNLTPLQASLMRDRLNVPSRDEVGGGGGELPLAITEVNDLSQGVNVTYVRQGNIVFATAVSSWGWGIGPFWTTIPQGFRATHPVSSGVAAFDYNFGISSAANLTASGNIMELYMIDGNTSFSANWMVSLSWVTTNAFPTELSAEDMEVKLAEFSKKCESAKLEFDKFMKLSPEERKVQFEKMQAEFKNKKEKQK